LRHIPAFLSSRRNAWYVISPKCPPSPVSLAFVKEEFYGKSLILADRDMVETESDEILRDAHTQDVALLVVGDPFGATTHTDILLRARALGISTRVIHNASIMNAVGACGLQLYNFGQTVSLVFFTDTWRPDSFYDRVRENADLGMHTLVLLDIKVKEQSEENLARYVCVWFA
jgi:diphthine synthase